ncbi:TrmH family RNA methyltransferase [Leucobacter sp. 1207-22]|uniref:TrmH family RNA methyltransferase n=1 Tax=Leucobacter sp. 1207-22 TaxID=2604456 RepID=UPI0040649F51
MNLTPITDIDAPELSDFTQLTDVALRRVREPAEGLYLAESSKVIARAIAAGHTPRAVLTTEAWLPQLGESLAGHPDVPVYVGSEAQLEQLTGFHMHRGVLASMHRPVVRDPLELLSTARRVAVLEGLTDHANVGSVFRNAAALGFDAVLVSPDCADPLYRRAVRVSMGTVFQVPWTRFEQWPQGIALLQDEGFVVAGMTLGEGAITLDQLVAEDHSKLAVVLGSEGHGITPKVDRRLDRRVTIPMMGGVDSLNVAAAAAVTFYATR